MHKEQQSRRVEGYPAACCSFNINPLCCHTGSHCDLMDLIDTDWGSDTKTKRCVCSLTPCEGHRFLNLIKCANFNVLGCEMNVNIKGIFFSVPAQFDA